MDEYRGGPAEGQAFNPQGDAAGHFPALMNTARKTRVKTQQFAAGKGGKIYIDWASASGPRRGRKARNPRPTETPADPTVARKPFLNFAGDEAANFPAFSPQAARAGQQGASAKTASGNTKRAPCKGRTQGHQGNYDPPKKCMSFVRPGQKRALVPGQGGRSHPLVQCHTPGWCPRIIVSRPANARLVARHPGLGVRKAI